VQLFFLCLKENEQSRLTPSGILTSFKRLISGSSIEVGRCVFKLFEFCELVFMDIENGRFGVCA